MCSARGRTRLSRFFDALQGWGTRHRPVNCGWGHAVALGSVGGCATERKNAGLKARGAMVSAEVDRGGQGGRRHFFTEVGAYVGA